MTKAIQVDNSEKNVNWIKSSPGYSDELRLHRELAEELRGTKEASHIIIKARIDPITKSLRVVESRI